jgi:uncharacterized protein related to proFAR isomerase
MREGSLMQVVPVIDVRGGVAVAAVRGDRTRYRPLETPLAESADPVAVARGIRSLFPFQTLYVADLDGIERRTPGFDTQRRLAEAWPGSELWIDDGGVGLMDANAGVPPTLALPTSSRRLASGEMGRGLVARDAPDGVPPPLWGRTGGGEAPRAPLIRSELPDPMIKSQVVGSESLQSLVDYEFTREAAGPAAPLSLDFRGDEFVGPPELLADASLWPDRIIVMTLARVGSGEGPDLARLRSVIVRAGQRKVFAAGGVRHADDLAMLRDIGAAGALVATALHQGHITRRDLETLAGM